MDVLRHGADVEVLAPAALRQAVASAHAKAAAQYSGRQQGESVER
jgi:predicted DNA-binding transcriptional regulator YafY